MQPGMGTCQCETHDVYSSQFPLWDFFECNRAVFGFLSGNWAGNTAVVYAGPAPATALIKIRTLFKDLGTPTYPVIPASQAFGHPHIDRRQPLLSNYLLDIILYSLRDINLFLRHVIDVAASYHGVKLPIGVHRLQAGLYGPAMASH